MSLVVIGHAHILRDDVRLLLHLLHAADHTALLPRFSLHHLLNRTHVDLLHPVPILLDQFFGNRQVFVAVLPLVFDEPIRQVVVVESVAVPAVVREIPARFRRPDDARSESKRFRSQTPLLSPSCYKFK